MLVGGHGPECAACACADRSVWWRAAFPPSCTAPRVLYHEGARRLERRTQPHGQCTLSGKPRLGPRPGARNHGARVCVLRPLLAASNRGLRPCAPAEVERSADWPQLGADGALIPLLYRFPALTSPPRAGRWSVGDKSPGLAAFLSARYTVLVGLAPGPNKTTLGPLRTVVNVKRV
jgi:hypothetical protein